MHFAFTFNKYLFVDAQCINYLLGLAFILALLALLLGRYYFCEINSQSEEMNAIFNGMNQQFIIDF